MRHNLIPVCHHGNKMEKDNYGQPEDFCTAGKDIKQSTGYAKHSGGSDSNQKDFPQIPQSYHVK